MTRRTKGGECSHPVQVFLLRNPITHSTERRGCISEYPNYIACHIRESALFEFAEDLRRYARIAAVAVSARLTSRP